MDYVSKYDCDNPQIKFKIEHTYRVAELAATIGASVENDSDSNVDLCWMIGLLHDIGRFEQLKRYGTFNDSQSVDHAELGADILFKDCVIEKFLPCALTGMPLEDEKNIIETAIRSHNKYRLQNELDNKMVFYCNVIRDADKIDIFRVACETPFEIRMSIKEDDNCLPASDEVMECVRSHRSIKKTPKMTSFELMIMGCAMAFDIVFDKSKEIIKTQGYLKKMLSFEPNELIQRQQMEMLRKELWYLC